MDDKQRSRVLAATVRLAKLGGRGVLVPGGYVLTAAHCIEWDGEGGMALGDFYVEPLETRCGRKVSAGVVAAEPVADVAALGPMDGQAAARECLAFEGFAAAVEGVPLCTRALEAGESVPVWVLTQTGAWVTGAATRDGSPGPPHGVVWLEADTRIRGGDSGSPVVNGAGELVGLVSHTDETDGPCAGMMPVPWLALPRWLADTIAAAAAEESPATAS